MHAELEREQAETGVAYDAALFERKLVAALNEQVNDIALELGLVAPTFAALFRVSLAAGTGGALLALFMNADLPLATRGTLALAAAGGGVCAAGVVAQFGRLAKSRASALRSSCDRIARSVMRTPGGLDQSYSARRG